MEFQKKYLTVFSLLLGFAVLCSAVLSALAQNAMPVMQTVTQTPAPVIVLDPGHGGEDGGAVSCTGCKESELNLEIGLRLNDLLRFFGIRTVMTRSEDKSVYDANAVTVSEKKVSDLKNRAKLTNETPNALFVSIHQNQFSDGKYSGAQVFYATTEGSRALAEQLQMLLRELLDPDNHREAKESSAVWLMEHINCTGVLVECGFLSNDEEEKRLKTPEYQKKLACVIACGITEYLTGEIEINES